MARHFASFPIGKTHLYVAARSVELHPVRTNWLRNHRSIDRVVHLHTLQDEMIGLCMELRCLKCSASGVIFFPEAYRW
ncbi:MAG: hypothetical protein HUU08_15940 [Candidatus Brocadia sp.]|nr:hypothetical protein [Candidatus Brocadia sp.]